MDIPKYTGNENDFRKDVEFACESILIDPPQMTDEQWKSCEKNCRLVGAAFGMNIEDIVIGLVIQLKQIRFRENFLTVVPRAVNPSPLTRGY